MNGHTLLLNASYEPLKVIPWQRAVTLLTLNKVEVLEEYPDKNLRSATWVIKMPAVARLLNMVKRKKKPVKFSRVNIYARDKYKCQYCGKKKPIKELTYDHVVPRSKGGKTSWNNITTACGPCNTKKGGRTPKEAGMKLIKKPKQPNWLPSVIITVNTKSLPDAWRDYLYWTGALEQD